MTLDEIFEYLHYPTVPASTRSSAPAMSQPIDVVDAALRFVGTRHQLPRHDVDVIANMLNTASCGESAVLIVEFKEWARNLSDSTASAATVVDALLDIRLALAEVLTPA